VNVILCLFWKAPQGNQMVVVLVDWADCMLVAAVVWREGDSHHHMERSVNGWRSIGYCKATS